MEKNTLWRWLVLVGITIISIAVVTPPSKKLTWGIDIKGGYSFVLSVDADDLRKKFEAEGKELTESDLGDAQQRALEVLRNRLDSLGTKETSLFAIPGTTRIELQIPGVGEADRAEISDVIRRVAYLQFRVVAQDNDQMVARVVAAGQNPPGYEFAMMSGSTPLYRRLTPSTTATLAEQDVAKELLRRFGGEYSFDFMLEPEVVDGITLFRPAFVSIQEELNGEAVRTAIPTMDQFGRPEVQLTFTDEGRKKFGKITDELRAGGARNANGQMGRRLAIVLDDTLYSAPEIKSAIYGGVASISGGNMSSADSSQLSLVLRAGALPAPLKFESEELISPTLGKSSINSGVRSALFGGAAVIIFMLVFYRLAGLVANLALVLDVLLLPLGMMLAAGFLGIFSDGAGGGSGGALPTLTLPGIAGLILTIGMAVDANVLIFERIREEQLAGKRFSSALTAGFDKVFSTIFDANVTTLIVAIILFVQGTGAIRGFAVTLTAGIIVSMYSALVFTRLLLGLVAKYSTAPKLNMMSMFGKTNIDFLAKKKFAIIGSVLVIAASWITLLGVKQDKALAVDFTGGRSLQFQVTGEYKPESDVRAMLAQVKADAPVITYRDSLDGTGVRNLTVTVKEADGDAVLAKLQSDYPGLSMTSDASISGQISNEMRNKGIMALLWAMVGIVIYISLRFEFSFAIGAIVAVFHDVIITIGLYTLFGRQLSLPIVAALLTIVGYSVNDTIVIFDRVREDLKLVKNKTYAEIVNIAMNKTLSRTILTSLTTLLTAVVLFLFGGGAINDFALTLVIGVIVGTYSTIFIAAPVMLLWHKNEKPTKVSV